MINMSVKKSASGMGKGKGRQTPGCESQTEKDCGNLVYLDWQIQDHCLELECIMYRTLRVYGKVQGWDPKAHCWLQQPSVEKCNSCFLGTVELLNAGNHEAFEIHV